MRAKALSTAALIGMGRKTITNLLVAAARALLQRIQAWMGGEKTGIADSEPLADLKLPDIVAPTSTRFRLTGDLLFRVLMRQLVVTFLLCMLAGLFISVTEAGPGLYVILTSLITHFLYLLLFMGNRWENGPAR